MRTALENLMSELTADFESNGDVDSPTGLFYLVDMSDPREVDDLIREYNTMFGSMLGYVSIDDLGYPWYIVRIDDAGMVWVYGYTSGAAAAVVFDDLDCEYEEWLADDETWMMN